MITEKKEFSMGSYSVMSLEYGEALNAALAARCESEGLIWRDRGEWGAAIDEGERALAVIAEHILNDLRPLELKRLSALLPLSENERMAILPLAERLSSDFEGMESASNAISAYFAENELLVTEGFVRFRMPELIEKWAAAVDRAGEELILGRSYSELYRILGLVAEVLPGTDRSAEACLMLHEDGSFVISDENGCRIESASCEPKSLMALLAALAPERLTVYDLTRGFAAPVLRAVREMFGYRARFFVIRV